MIAALPMYDPPHLHAANDRLWQRIRDHLRAAGHPAPDSLTRDGELWPLWRAHGLVLAQTCGLPYRAQLHGQVTLVGTPDYGVPGCPAGHYRSVLVVRADDPRGGPFDFDGAVLALNDPLSQSGYAAPLAHAADLGIRLVPGPVTGAHSASAAAVAEGRADIAAIDAVTWAILSPHHPAAARLRVIGMTHPTPGLPLITRAGDPEALFAAAAAAIAGLDNATRAALHLKGIVRIPAADYLALPIPPPPGG